MLELVWERVWPDYDGTFYRVCKSRMEFFSFYTGQSQCDTEAHGTRSTVQYMYEYFALLFSYSQQTCTAILVRQAN